MDFFACLVDQSELNAIREGMQGEAMGTTGIKREKFPLADELMEKGGFSERKGNSAQYKGTRFYWFYRSHPTNFEFGCPKHDDPKEWIFAINGKNEKDQYRVYATKNQQDAKGDAEHRTLKTPSDSDYGSFVDAEGLAELIKDTIEKDGGQHGE